jgi:hypothetical protein
MMISFRETKELREGSLCSAYRWSLRLSWTFIGLVRQFHYNGEWADSHTMVYCIALMKDIEWGAYHFWYEGPHCLFSLGPFRVQWYNSSCEICNKD